LSGRRDVKSEEPLFPSRKGHYKPLSRVQAWNILSSVGQLVGLNNMGTHTLRKTFGYHIYKKSGGNLALVQKLLNRSSDGDTLRYIGIDREQTDNAYLELNM
jgi:integrase